MGERERVGEREREREREREWEGVRELYARTHKHKETLRKRHGAQSLTKKNIEQMTWSATSALAPTNPPPLLPVTPPTPVPLQHCSSHTIAPILSDVNNNFTCKQQFSTQHYSSRMPPTRPFSPLPHTGKWQKLGHYTPLLPITTGPVGRSRSGSGGASGVGYGGW